VIIDDYVCELCNREYNNIDKCSDIPFCCGQPTVKNWAHCNVRALNRGEPVNARLCNDGTTVNRFHAKDDPLTAIEVGLKSDNHSGTRTFSKEQAAYYRAKVQKEDSPRLRQEILDVRDKNLAERKYNKQKKSTSLIKGV